MLDSVKWRLYYKARCAPTRDALRHYKTECKFVVTHVQTLLAHHKAMVRSTRTFMREHEQLLTEYTAHMQRFYDFVARVDMLQSPSRLHRCRRDHDAVAHRDSPAQCRGRGGDGAFGRDAIDNNDDNDDEAEAAAVIATAHSRTRVLHSVMRTRRAQHELSEQRTSALLWQTLEQSAAAHTRDLRCVLDKAHALRDRCRRLLSMAEKMDKLTWSLQRLAPTAPRVSAQLADGARQTTTTTTASTTDGDGDANAHTRQPSQQPRRRALEQQQQLQQRIDAHLDSLDAEHAAFVHAFTSFVCADVVTVATSCAHFGDVLQHLRRYMDVLERFVTPDGSDGSNSGAPAHDAASLEVKCLSNAASLQHAWTATTTAATATTTTTTTTTPTAATHTPLGAVLRPCTAMSTLADALALRTTPSLQSSGLVQACEVDTVRRPTRTADGRAHDAAQTTTTRGAAIDDDADEQNAWLQALPRQPPTTRCRDSTATSTSSSTTTARVADASPSRAAARTSLSATLPRHDDDVDAAAVAAHGDAVCVRHVGAHTTTTAGMSTREAAAATPTKHNNNSNNNNSSNNNNNHSHTGCSGDAAAATAPPMPPCAHVCSNSADARRGVRCVASEPIYDHESNDVNNDNHNDNNDSDSELRDRRTDDNDGDRGVYSAAARTWLPTQRRVVATAAAAAAPPQRSALRAHARDASGQAHDTHTHTTALSSLLRRRPHDGPLPTASSPCATRALSSPRPQPPRVDVVVTHATAPLLSASTDDAASATALCATPHSFARGV